MIRDGGIMKNTAQDLFRSPSLTNLDSNLKIARKILNEVMNYRRVEKAGQSCGGTNCEHCASYHLPKIMAAIQKNEPVVFVLPAFPGKSPNPQKVLGHLPDFAEKLALSFLGQLCNSIKEFYSPGIKMIICSDGRVFSDLIGMKETHVTAYQKEIDVQIDRMNLVDVMTFNLDDFYKNLSFSQMRDELMKRFGTSLEILKHKVKNGNQTTAQFEEQEAHSMYCGITRFLFEDALFPGQTKSRTAIQKESKIKAYEVIRRSNAWSELIAECFPEAVRLSIHPQSCGSKKLGIRLIGSETWMTPWHGVAVETPSGYVLLKRSQAESLGAEMIYSEDGRPSHFKLNHSQISEAI